MKMKNPTTVFWFRRDLRLDDNHGLFQACEKGNVLPLFIFDENILEELSKEDARVSFIYEQLSKLDTRLKSYGSSLLVKKGNPTDVWKQLLVEFEIANVITNKDFEPYAIQRDKEVESLLSTHGVTFKTFLDHLVFEPNAILKDDGNPYTIYTPYKNKWLKKFQDGTINPFDTPNPDSFFQIKLEMPELQSIGFIPTQIKVLPVTFQHVEDYDKLRDFPALDGTTHLGPHLRFGTVGIRRILKEQGFKNETFLSELIWREFFIQILFHFPQVVHQSFRVKYNNIKWLNNDQHFEKWCKGQTGYPMVDAGMRELNATGYMHNRVRMVVASFLCKHLLIDWRRGEAYFAEKLLDYELASNNGNWQWAAGTGCDAAPYFRVFNPSEQLKKFDGQMEYIKKWIPELMSGNYTSPIVDHATARVRAIEVYKKGLSY